MKKERIKEIYVDVENGTFVFVGESGKNYYPESRDITGNWNEISFSVDGVTNPKTE